MAERKIQFKIEALGTDDLSVQITELQNELVGLAERRKELNKQFKEGTITQENYSKQLADNKIKTKQLNTELNKNTKQLLETRKGAVEATNSYDALTKRNNQLKKQLRAMPDAFDETNESANALKEEIRANTEQLKKFDKEIGDNFRNVGNYADAIQDAFKGSSVFGDAIQNNTTVVNNYQQNITQLTQITQTLTSVTNTAITNFFGLGKATGGAVKGFKALRVALISTGIGAIVVALGSLVAFLTQTKKGSEALEVAMAGLQAIFSNLLGVVVKFGESIFDAFSNPQEALKSFGESIKTFFIDRINAGLALIGFLGDAVKAVFEGDFEKAGEAVKNAGQEFLKLNPILNVVSEAIVKVGNDIVESVNKATEIQKLEILYRNLSGELAVVNTQLEGQRDLLQATADDATLTFAEREKAILGVVAKNEELAENEQKLADLQLKIATARRQEAEKNGLITDEILQAELDAQQRVIQADNAVLLAQQENEKTRRELKSDRLEQDLDILIDGFDKQKTINERIIADDDRTQQERRALLAETQRLADESFDAQIGIIEDFAGKSIDANDLINESDATVLAEKIRNLGLSEAIGKRALEIINERKLAEQDFAETKKALDDEVTDNEVKNLEKRAKENEKYANVVGGAFEDIGQAFGEFLFNSELEQGEFLKNTILTLLTAVQQTANLMIASATAQSFAQPDSVATVGVSGAIRASALTALINTAVAIARAGVKNAKFEKGGLLDGAIFEGASHANGGVKFASGGRIMEAEGGEAIINKRSTAMFKPILSALNVAGGGKKFADGGVLGAIGSLGASNIINNITAQANVSDELVSKFADVVNTIKVTNVVTDTEANITRVKNIQNEATI